MSCLSSLMFGLVGFFVISGVGKMPWDNEYYEFALRSRYLTVRPRIGNGVFSFRRNLANAEHDR